MKESRLPFDPGHLKVGVLALQGSFREHLAVLSRIGVQVVEIRLPEQIHDLDGIIIPGGESTRPAEPRYEQSDRSTVSL